MHAYLAEKYMSGPKAEAIIARTAPKKKKRKPANNATAGPSMFVDEDAGFGDEASRRLREDDMDVAEAAVASDRSFKKRKTDDRSGWIRVQEGAKREEESPPPPEDEQPTVVEEQRPFTGGLIRAEELRKQTKSHVKQDEEAQEALEAAQETVYRDASGRKIDMKLARAEAARKKREKEEKDAQKMEWGKGLVQREEREKHRSQLEKNKALPFSRHADDRELNEELKAREMWNDPAAAFMTKKSKGPRKPEYRGPPPPPNRFGIKPGYRWDGVDRANGFEKKWFQRINERKRTATASYEWSVDDM